jgi:hypothetical protein
MNDGKVKIENETENEKKKSQTRKSNEKNDK